MTNTDTTITYCPGCARPTHAAESDDHNRCAICAAGTEFANLVIEARPCGRTVEARVTLPRIVTGPHEARRGLAALHWLAAAVTLATPDLIGAGMGCSVTVYHNDQLGDYRGAVIIDSDPGTRDAMVGVVTRLAQAVAT